MTRPRVLAVTNELPWPLNSGGRIRTYHLLKSLASCTRLRLVCPVQRSQQGLSDPIRAAGIEFVPVVVNERSHLVETGRLLAALVRREPYVMYRRHAWPAAAAAWHAELVSAEPDVLYFDHLDSFVYRSWNWPAPETPSVIDLHNAYSLIARRSATDDRSPYKRAFLRHQVPLLEDMERQVARSCTALFAVSNAEAGYFEALGAPSVQTIPNGVDCAAFSGLPTGRTGPPTILSLGSMSWGPNATAARFLAREVFPELKKRVADARLLIVGRDPSDEVLALGRTPGIEVTGTVDDVTPYLREAAVLTVPLDSGGGTRLKILEAFAAGLPVVSTAVGAEGIEAIAGRHFIQAERPEFLDAVTRLLDDRAAGTELAKAARCLAHDKYDWHNIGARAASVVADLAVHASDADSRRRRR